MTITRHKKSDHNDKRLPLTCFDGVGHARDGWRGPAENVDDRAFALETAPDVIQAHFVAHGPLRRQWRKLLGGAGGRPGPGKKRRRS